MSDLLLYLQNFCRFTLLFVFALSSINKLRNFFAFEQVIQNFKLLPHRLIRISAVFFLISEVTVIVLLLLGGKWLGLAFTIAIAQIIIFSIVLASAIMRKIKTPCNCFATSNQPVSHYELWRNGGVIVFALIGLISSTVNISLNLSLFETGFIAIMAIPFVMIFVNFGTLRTLFQ